LQVQPHRARLAPFPVVEKAEEQSVSVQHPGREDPAPALATLSAVESTNPAAPLAQVSSSGMFNEIPAYWRMHRSHSAVAVFVRSALSPWPLLRNLVLWLRGPTKKSVAHRNILAVIANWLREPISPGNIFSNR
jgi:hypothetical protein